jgi:Flp pilus assembly secretin CpaC
MHWGIFRACVLAIVAIALSSEVSFAQVLPAQTAEPVQLTPGFTRLIRFDRPIATVVIGNPEVADARAQTDRSIALVGKAVGITNLIALDNTGAEVFTSLVVVGARDAGKVIINARKQLHEYWAYRCTSDNCVRVEDRLEYLQPAAPIVVAPTAPAPAPATQ